MPGRARSKVRHELMFHDLAKYFDLLASHKDYGAEANYLARLVQKAGRSGGKDWLDVACGTGRHLEHLRRLYDVVGIDLSPEMLRIALGRLPGADLRRGDMRNFRLGREFDVVTCLFSAIGHLGSERELAVTFANFVRHLKPGGVAIVEPWLSPEMFRSGSVHLMTGQAPGLVVARLAFSRRRGNRSMIEYHYSIGEEGRGIQHFEETNVGLLVSPSRLVELLKEAGLRARFVKQGLTPGRGLLLGVKPKSARAPES